MALILKRPVTVKHVVAEAFKEATLREIAATPHLKRRELQGRGLIAELERQAPAQAVPGATPRKPARGTAGKTDTNRPPRAEQPLHLGNR